MAVPFVKIYYTTPSGVEYDITDYSVLSDKRGLQIKDAKADISLNNSAYRYKVGGESIFIEDGSVEVYADYSPIDRSASQLLLNGQIQEITHNLGQNSRTKFSVSDRTTLLLSGIWGFTYEGESVDSIIRSIINNAPTAGGLVTTNNVATSTTSGSAFPSIDMAKTMKPVYEWLTDLSQPGVTGEDKAYLFYVDKDNDLHWFYPSSTVSSSITEGTDELYTISMKKSQDELINMLIYNAGQDLKGNGILWYKYDSRSKSNKLRMKFQPMTDIGRDLFENEIRAGDLVETTGGAFHYQGKDYDAVPSYPFTPAWTGAPPVSDDDEYNDAFRSECKLRADDRSLSYMQHFSGLRWKGNIELKGDNGYVAGDLLTVNLPTIGIVNKNLRVWDVVHNVGGDGWLTTLELREDDEAINSS